MTTAVLFNKFASVFENLSAERVFKNLTDNFAYYTLLYNKQFSYFQMLNRIFTELWATELHHHLINFSASTIAQKEFLKM